VRPVPSAPSRPVPTTPPASAGGGWGSSSGVRGDIRGSSVPTTPAPAPSQPPVVRRVPMPSPVPVRPVEGGQPSNPQPVQNTPPNRRVGQPAGQ
jgi:hypothetical protein